MDYRFSHTRRVIVVAGAGESKAAHDISALGFLITVKRRCSHEAGGVRRPGNRVDSRTMDSDDEVASEID